MTPHQAAVAILLLVTVCSGGELPAASPHTIQVGPQNVASYQGPTVTLPCTSSIGGRVMWYEFITNSAGSLISDGSTLITSHPNYLRYRLTVNTTIGQYDLGVTPSQLKDGGRYSCEDGTTSYKSAEVVMLGNKANCTTSLPANGIVTEGVYYSIDCTQYFQASAGKGVPFISWTGPGTYNTLYFPGNGSVFGGVNFNVQKAMDAGKFTAKVNFTQDQFADSSVESADNVPAFTDTWISQTLYVQYGPQNSYYSPVKTEYNIGDTITCYSTASPLPTYTWTDLRTLIEYNSQQILITEAMAGWLNLRCQIVNIISTANVIVNSTVRPPSTTPPPTTTTTTTPIPAVSNCLDLTGRWEHTRANDSKAVLCLYVDKKQNGYLSGLLWNDTKTEAYYLEIMGRTRNNVFDETGFVGIWPVEVGVSAFAAECHRCYNEESLLVNPLSRSSTDNDFCGHGGTLLHGPQYSFKRVPPSHPCATGTTWKEMREISREAAARRRRRQAELAQ